MVLRANANEILDFIKHTKMKGNEYVVIKQINSEILMLMSNLECLISQPMCSVWNDVENFTLAIPINVINGIPRDTVIDIEDSGAIYFEDNALFFGKITLDSAAYPPEFENCKKQNCPILLNEDAVHKALEVSYVPKSDKDDRIKGEYAGFTGSLVYGLSGYRASWRECETKEDVVLPHYVMNLLRKIKPRLVKIHKNTGYLLVEFDDWEILVKELETLPNANTVSKISQNADTENNELSSVHFDTADLKRLIALFDKKGAPVEIEITSKGVKLSQATGLIKSEGFLNVTLPDSNLNACSIYLNPKYLAEAVTKLKTKKSVFYYNSPVNPVMLSPVDVNPSKHTELILPVRVAKVGD